MNQNQMDWDSGAEQGHTSSLVILHRLLRGRYVLAFSLALVFGIAGGVLGYLSRQPMYQSTGVIRIQPSLPKVLYESEQSTATSMFSSFVSSQASLINNGGVIQRALESDEWKAVSRFSDIQSVRDVQQRLVVRPEPRAQEIITVSFSDEDPRVSAAIVRAVMQSYLEEYGKEGSINNPEIREALNNRRTVLLAERDNLDKQITRKTQRYSTENLSPLIENAQYTIRLLEAQRTELANQQALYREFTEKNQGAEADPLSAEEAAAFDPVIADILSQQTELVNAREEMMASERLGPEHREVRRVTAMIDSLQSRIDARIKQLSSEERTTLLVDENGKPIPSQDILSLKIDRIDAQIKDAKDQSESLFSDSVELDTLRDDREDVQASISLVNSRLDQIRTESQVEDMKQVSGKISIPTLPTPASSPTSDPRIKMAAVGFVGASSLPIMVILALGYFSHRIQYSDDDILSGTGAGIIGMLPDLGNSLADKELAAASAFAVHQIRSQLQIKNTTGGGMVYGVTSPAPQDGKTSLIIAMGLSFAESGDRTLLIDLDFIGRGLSVHFGYPNAPSLAEALGSQDEIRSLIHETEFEGLSVLPAGFGDDERVSRLSPRSVGGFIDALRTHYDTILIDSGPILGSVEAAFVAPQADGVIIVVGRGQYKPLVRKAIDQVLAVDGTILATIFNRASVQELRQSSNSMSVHFSRQLSRQQQAISERPNLRVGPLAGTLFRAKDEQAAESAAGEGIGS